MKENKLRVSAIRRWPMVTWRNRILSIIALVWLVVILGCDHQNNKVCELELTNPSDFKLLGKNVSIDRNMLFNDSGDTKQFPLLMLNSDTIPSQLSDTDGDGRWDELFFVIDFQEKEKKTLQLNWIDGPIKYVKRTSVRFGKRNAATEPLQPATEEVLLASDMPKKIGFQKYQTDGPTWENDKVGFRHYLDGRNAKDIFGKRNAQITPEAVGIGDAGEVEDNYHTMHDWGRDIFPVGNSLGLGGYGLLIDNEIVRLGVTADDTLSNIEKTTFKIVEEGPVKSILKYSYNNWSVGNDKYQVGETTVIWPGNYFYENTVTMNGLKGGEILLIGLSNINCKKTIQKVESGEWVALLQHDSLTYDRKWIMGTALILPQSAYQGYMQAHKTGHVTNSYLAQLDVSNNSPITYYAVAGWELSQEKQFQDASFFRDYVITLADQLYTDIDIEIIE